MDKWLHIHCVLLEHNCDLIEYLEKGLNRFTFIFEEVELRLGEESNNGILKSSKNICFQ